MSALAVAIAKHASVSSSCSSVERYRCSSWLYREVAETSTTSLWEGEVSAICEQEFVQIIPGLLASQIGEDSSVCWIWNENSFIGDWCEQALEVTHHSELDREDDSEFFLVCSATRGESCLGSMRVCSRTSPRCINAASGVTAQQRDRSRGYVSRCNGRAIVQTAFRRLLLDIPPDCNPCARTCQCTNLSLWKEHVPGSSRRRPSLYGYEKLNSGELEVEVFYVNIFSVSTRIFLCPRLR